MELEILWSLYDNKVDNIHVLHTHTHIKFPIVQYLCSLRYYFAAFHCFLGCTIFYTFHTNLTYKGQKLWSAFTRILKIIWKIYYCKYAISKINWNLFYAWKTVPKGMKLRGIFLVSFLLDYIAYWGCWEVDSGLFMWFLRSDFLSQAPRAKCPMLLLGRYLF